MIERVNKGSADPYIGVPFFEFLWKSRLVPVDDVTAKSKDGPVTATFTDLENRGHLFDVGPVTGLSKRESS